MEAPMAIKLITKAEEEAVKAEELPAFSGVKLLHIKREVANLLQLIGREGIFAQYTTHDISHVEEMLRILDWLVPQRSRSAMTPADWL
jgi:molecular chaperone HtpG